jgi:hypothetical protein
MCALADPGLEHRYVTPCHCPKGDGPGGRTRAAQLEDMSETIRVTPAKKCTGSSRFGR